MMIYNVTFMVERGRKVDFLKWLRSEGLPLMTGADSGARNARLTTVVEVPGDPEFGLQACSLAFQVEFDTLEEAHMWGKGSLERGLESFSRRFPQEEGLVFTTILEELSLEGE